MPTVTVKKRHINCVQVTDLDLPMWMVLAIDGQRINAVKQLRDIGGKSADTDRLIDLKAAVNIVDNLRAHLVTYTLEEDE